LKIEEVSEAHMDFAVIAKLWKNVSDLFYKAGESSELRYINDASEILLVLSEKERIAMEKLKNTKALQKSG